MKSRKCVGIYTLAQVLCAFVGLILGFLLVILIQKPELSAAARPFGVYLAAPLALPEPFTAHPAGTGRHPGKPLSHPPCGKRRMPAPLSGEPKHASEHAGGAGRPRGGGGGPGGE
ncbi:MAG: hypothetical protein J5633_04780 [Oscillospiraceae bacterium]|nr:hypothetical protein [Oscillospiraceae bacterium]